MEHLTHRAASSNVPARTCGVTSQERIPCALMSLAIIIGTSGGPTYAYALRIGDRPVTGATVWIASRLDRTGPQVTSGECD